MSKFFTCNHKLWFDVSFGKRDFSDIFFTSKIEVVISPSFSWIDMHLPPLWIWLKFISNLTFNLSKFCNNNNDKKIENSNKLQIFDLSLIQNNLYKIFSSSYRFFSTWVKPSFSDFSKKKNNTRQNESYWDMNCNYDDVHIFNI